MTERAKSADVSDAVAGAATFLTWVAESYRAHAKDPENHPEIADAYEGSAQMAEGHAAALRAAFQLGEGTKN